MTYRLHYAPDNASLVIRLALIEMEQPFDTVLVDRSTRAQDSAGYRALAPTGLIPCLETDEGVLFETGAILLWLADRHDRMAPPMDHPQRGNFLKWLFFTANTLHADARMMFYPHYFVGDDPAAQAGLRAQVRGRLLRHIALLEGMTQEKTEFQAPHNPPSVLTYYIACLIRWLQLYPADGSDWLRLTEYPALRELLALLEVRPATLAAIKAEGLGKHPFTKPQHPTPPEGSAL